MKKIINELRANGTLAELNEVIPYSGFIGFDLFEDEKGLVSLLKANPDNIGNEVIGAIHGGVVAAFLEHAASLHLLVINEALSIPRIVNISIDYLRPALNKDTYARVQVVKQGKRVANVRILAWQEDENRAVAIGHAHFLIA